jgi:hypothetical protein
MIVLFAAAGASQSQDNRKLIAAGSADHEIVRAGKLGGIR